VLYFKGEMIMEERFNKLEKKLDHGLNEVKEGINALLTAIEALGQGQQELRKDVNELKSGQEDLRKGQEELTESIKALTIVAEEADRERIIIKRDIKDIKESQNEIKKRLGSLEKLQDVTHKSYAGRFRELEVRIDEVESSFPPAKQ